MAEYGGTLFGVCLLGALIRMLSPEGDMKRYIGLVSAFCVLLAVAKPLIVQYESKEGLFWEEWGAGGEQESVNYDEIYDQSLIGAGGMLAENQIKLLIIKEFSLSEEDVSVQGDFEMKNGIGTIRQITLYLHRSTISVDPRELTEYLTKCYACPCVVLYGN